MNSKLYINILTNSSLASVSDGKKLLEIWVAELSSFIPDKVGNYEPLKKEFDFEKIDSLLSIWDFPFLLKRKKPRMSGNIFIAGGKVPTHGWIHIVLEFKQSQQNEIIDFVKKVSAVFDVDFAFIHLLTKEEFPNSFKTGVFTFKNDNSENVLSVTTHELRKSIPNLYWGTFFGSSYIRLFGEQKLCSLPDCCIVEKLDKELYYIQLSEKISDLETDFNLVNECRKKVKKHLDCDAFFSSVNNSSHQYSIPVFSKIEVLGGHQKND